MDSRRKSRISKMKTKFRFRQMTLIGILLYLCQLSSQQTEAQQIDSSKGCPYPSVNVNCQVNIISQLPSVSLISTEYVSDEYATLKHETQASYKCDQGYTLIGKETITCLASGRWSAPAPLCVTNIAIGKPTNQSSTVKGGDSKNANDGKTTNQHDQKHCTETKSDQSPWWQIDLLQPYDVIAVRILSRACCNPTYSLHDLEIRVGNASGLQGNRLCAWHPETIDEGSSQDFRCAHPIIGRYVSIQMVGIESPLSLCEVAVLSTSEFPSERCNVQALTAPTGPSAASALQQSTSAAENLIVFNKTCYELQSSSSGGSYLVADTYCKARRGALLNSVTNLTHSFVSAELEKSKTKLKSKLVWLGARRDNAGQWPASPGAGQLGGESMLGSNIGSPSINSFAIQDSSAPFPRSMMASLEEFSQPDGRQSSTALMRVTRSLMYHSSSGAGGSFSRGSQTFGLTTNHQNHSTISGRISDHGPRSLFVSQPNQVASSFFQPPVISQPQMVSSNIVSPTTPASSIASSLQNPTNFHIQRIKPPALTLHHQHHSMANTGQASNAQASFSQPTQAPQLQQQQQNSGWHWVTYPELASPSNSQSNAISNFLWADDQPNNYNSQQDCIAMDGSKRWLWNDVTCELDYLPWMCQYRAASCGYPDRNENSTILETQTQATVGSSTHRDDLEAFKFGKTVTYACPAGHRLVDGSRERTCLANGAWSGFAPKCEYINCGTIQASIENGRLVYLNESQTTFGSVVKYVCSEDYVLVGSDLRQCSFDGKWSGKQPFCAYKWCPLLPQIANGSVDAPALRGEGSIATYSCSAGFKLIGNDTRQCLLGGKWTNQEPFCQFVDCGSPKRIANGKFELVNGTSNYLSVAAYSCNTNYTLSSGNDKLICQHTNRWTGREPECSLINCGKPTANSGSSFKGSSFAVHSSVHYKCDLGYKETLGNSVRTCNLNGQWSGQALSCKFVDCGRVPAILKGEVTYVNGTTYLASVVSYECPAGSKVGGNKQRVCQADGRWSGASPKCEEVRCLAPELPENGSAVYIGNDRSSSEQSFSVGVTVQYECDYGHVVTGTWASRLCQASGEWSGEAPKCSFVDCGKPYSIEHGSYQLKRAQIIDNTSSSMRLRSSQAASLSQQQTTSVSTVYGTIAHYTCDTNFKLQGSGQRECLANGTWRQPAPSCEPIQCSKVDFFDEQTLVSYITRESISESLPTGNSAALDLRSLSSAIKLVVNGQLTQAAASASLQFNVGDRLLYSCSPGFELYGGPESRTCTQYGQWSGSSTPRCRLIDCGKPMPIGQEGRYFLLNDSTVFNSLVEYSCVRPFKLVEFKVRQNGQNLIETLANAQAGVSSLLTALPIGVKICANNKMWMPNDQQPKCVSATEASNFDNSLQLDVSQTSNSNNFNSNQDNQFIRNNNNNIELLNEEHQLESIVSSSSWSARSARFAIIICLIIMLALIVITVICIRLSGKPKRNANPAQRATSAQMQSPMTNNNNNFHALHVPAGALAKCLNAVTNFTHHNHNHHQHQQQQQPQHHNRQPANNQMSVLQQQQQQQQQMMIQNNMFMANNHMQNMIRNVYNETQPTGEAAPMALLNNLGNAERIAKAHTLASFGSAQHTLDADAYLRLTLESEAAGAMNQLQHSQLQQLPLTTTATANTKTIRHNPNGLVTFVSPTQQQQQQQQQQQPVRSQLNGKGQHQASPQSVSSSAASTASSNDSSSAQHTNTRLTDSSSSSCSYIGQPPPQTSPPSLPQYPPPAHRIIGLNASQQAALALNNASRHIQQHQQSSLSASSVILNANNSHIIGSNSSHYTEPTNNNDKQL